MFRGTEYAIGEIIWWLLAALIIGLLIGWILRRWFLREALRRDFETRLASERGRMSRLETEIVERDKERERLETRLAEADKRANALAAELESRTSALDLATSRIGDLEADLSAARPGHAATDHDAETDRALEERVDALGADVTGLKDQVSERDDRIATLERELADTTADRERLMADLAARDAAISDLEGRVGSGAHGDERVGQLESEIAGLRDEIDEQDQRTRGLETPAATSGAGPEPASTPSVEEARAEMGAIAERTRDGAAPVDDNLKKVRGIGPKIEALLKGMGITSFRQIANFEERDIAVVAAALESFPDRIERDAWIARAASEHRRKYGEDV